MRSTVTVLLAIAGRLVTLLASSETATSIGQGANSGFLARLERSAQTGRLVGDGLSTEVIVTAGGTTQQSVYHGNVPAKLRALEAGVERFRLALEREGERSVLHKGTPLVPPPPPRDRK